jgi:hypothetical protein
VARAGHDNVKAIFFGPLRAQGKRRGQGRQCRRLHEFAPAHFAHETLPSKQALTMDFIFSEARAGE